MTAPERDWVQIGLDAIEAHRYHLEALRTACEEIPDVRHRISRLKREIDEIEAEAVLNGQAAGENEQKRKAALLYALKGNEDHRAAVVNLREAEGQLSTYELESGVSEHGMKGCRATLEWLTSVNNRLGPQDTLAVRTGAPR